MPQSSKLFCLSVVAYGALQQCTGKRLQQHAKKEEHKVEWRGVYGACSVGCGAGIQQLNIGPGSMHCVYEGGTWFTSNEAPRELCEKQRPTLAMPTSTHTCESIETCEWKAGAPPPDRCGWADVQCAPEGGEATKGVDITAFCERAEKRIGKKDDFQAKHALVNDGCPRASLTSLCTITINRPAADHPFGDTSRSLAHVQAYASQAIQGCNGADIITFATQEFTNSWGDIFKRFQPSRAALEDLYEEVGRCGGKISPGVVVIAKRELRKYFAPIEGVCVQDDNIYGGDTAISNVKGTTFLELFTVIGPFVSASTHGARGDVVCEARAGMIAGATKRIMAWSPKIVAWAGDFNPRTPVDAHEDILTLGTTHPPEGTTSLTKVDPNNAWAMWFNPTKAYEMLAAADDLLGGEDGKSLQETLQDASGGQLMEVPVKHLCPTYKKKRKDVFKSTDMLLLADGTTEPEGWFGSPDGSQEIKEWNPSFACKAPGCTSDDCVEHYGSPMDGKTKWPWTSPSWTERIVVMTSTGQRCDPAGKVKVKSDHDVLYARCDLSMVEPVHL